MSQIIKPFLLRSRKRRKTAARFLQERHKGFEKKQPLTRGKHKKGSKVCDNLRRVSTSWPEGIRSQSQSNGNRFYDHRCKIIPRRPKIHEDRHNHDYSTHIKSHPRNDRLYHSIKSFIKLPAVSCSDVFPTHQTKSRDLCRRVRQKRIYAWQQSW